MSFSMPRGPFMQLDENIVHPKRMLIMTVLFLARKITEGELSKATNISWGSLSTHLSKLERKGYIRRRKTITNRGVRTVVEITEKGYEAYKKEIEKIRALIEHQDKKLLF